jgi:hypothetical protein
MATLFLRQQGVYNTAPVTYDASQLPPNPEPGRSAVCHSCLVTLAAEGSSVSGASHLEELLHCYACRKEANQVDAPTADVHVLQMVNYGLASQMVGKYIEAPPLHKLEHELAAGKSTFWDSTTDAGTRGKIEDDLAARSSTSAGGSSGSSKPLKAPEPDQAASRSNGAGASAAHDSVGRGSSSRSKATARSTSRPAASKPARS